MVFGAIKSLLKKGRLHQPGGKGAPYFLVVENPPPIDDPTDDTPLIDDDPPDIEIINQKIREKLASELLQEIKKKSPAFFEKLVVKLLENMGYGGPWENAGEVTGGPGDGGIDGIIYQDKLGLDVVGIQAKLRTTGDNINPSVINEFVGALRLNGLSKGVLITTTGFSKNASSLSTLKVWV